MKTTLLLIIFCLCWISITAQPPLFFNYQAVARDASGNILVNRSVSFRISILSGSASGSALYSETHSGITTNAFGLVTLEIGKGNIVSGTFSAIPWGNNTYFVKIEMDPLGGNNYLTMGSSQLVSVPYALFSKNAENEFSGNYNDLTNKPSFAKVATSGNYNDLADKPTFASVAVSGSYSDLANKPVTDGSETKVSAGTNVSVTGSGTAASPYLINAITSHYPGELYGGGVVFYVDHTGQHGLIVSMIDLASEKWSNVNDSLGVAANNPWNGQNNTNAIIAQTGHTISAAKLCNDYTNVNFGTGVYSDWYLPAINQLSQLYQSIYEVNKTLDNDGNSSTTTLYYKPYWSSTENWNIYARGYACFFNFETGVCDRYSKFNTLVVRAIRSF